MTPRYHRHVASSVGGLAMASILLAATSASALPLQYVFTGQFMGDAFLGADLIENRDFEVTIFTNTATPDGDPGNPDRGEFAGPFNAQISIEGFGLFSFVNPISTITEWIDGPFEPVESRAVFGNGSTSHLIAVAEDTFSPFFGDPNLLDAFPGGASVIVVDFNSEPVIPVGATESILLSGFSGGGSVRATIVATVPDHGFSLFLLSGALALLGSARLLRRRPVTG